MGQGESGRCNWMKENGPQKMKLGDPKKCVGGQKGMKVDCPQKCVGT